MADWILLLTGLAIYVGAVIAVLFEGVRPEIRDVNRTKEEFRQQYQDKVSVLQGKAEVSLIEAISNAEKLREIFGRPVSQGSAVSGQISPDERARIDKEIAAITARMRDITEPRELFETVLKDFGTRSESCRISEPSVSR